MKRKPKMKNRKIELTKKTEEEERKINNKVFMYLFALLFLISSITSVSLLQELCRITPLTLPLLLSLTCYFSLMLLTDVFYHRYRSIETTPALSRV